MSDDTAIKAFIAGFDLSEEGWNGEYGGPSEEWLTYLFYKWRDGKSLPECCGVRRDPKSKSFVISPPCSRPQGHSDLHSWEAAG